MKRKGRFLLSGLLLSAISLLMRAIAVAFNVYLSRKIGADGIGLYQLIMSVYGLGVTLATSGVGIAATRLVAEELAKPDGKPRGALRRCMTYAIIGGVAAGVLLFFTADAVGAGWLRDVRTVASLRLMALSFPFIACSAALHGWFTAVRRVWKSAAAQLAEQGVRIGLCVLGLTLLAPSGLEYACIAIVGGGALAEVFSAVMSGLLYAAERRKSRGGAVAMKKVTAIALPVAAAAWARAAINTVKQAMIPAGLQRYGLSREAALGQYGRITGMVLPVILFPSAFLYSYAGLLIPEVTEFQTKGDRSAVERVITSVLSAVMTFAAAAGGVFLLAGKELGVLLYSDAEAGKQIMLFGPLVIAMYLDSAIDGILKGLNEHKAVMGINLIDSAATLALVVILVPKIGVNGYITAVFLTEILNTSLSLARLLKVTGYKADFLRIFVLPCALMLAASLPAVLLKSALPSSPSSAIGCAAVALLLYLGAATASRKGKGSPVRRPSARSRRLL